MKFGAGVTVTVMGNDLTIPPPVPTTLIVYLPGTVLVVGTSVKMLLPAPGAAKEETENLPVIPVGKPLKLRLVAALKVPISETLTLTVAEVFCTMNTELPPAVSPKLGGTTSVSGRLSVWLNEPPLAVTAKLYVPAVALAGVVMVRFAVPVPGTNVVGEKLVVTPLGWPLTAKASAAGKTPCGRAHVKRTFVP